MRSDDCKFTYRGEIFSKETILQNIERYYCGITHPNTTFYEEANQFCCDVSFGIQYSQVIVAGVVAALSPMKLWDDNKQLAIDFFNGNCHGQMFAQISKAKQILICHADDIPEILHGDKTKNFFLNIIGDKDSVTIDRHTFNAAVGKNVYKGLSNNVYRIVESCFKTVAKNLNVKVSEMQSAVWYQWRTKES